MSKLMSNDMYDISVLLRVGSVEDSMAGMQMVGGGRMYVQSAS